jgi:probable rRNA maturation factor
MTVVITLQDPRWKKALRPYCKTVRGVVSTLSLWERGGQNTSYKFGLGEGSSANISSQKHISSHPNPLPEGEGIIQLAIVLANDAFVQDLNHKFRGKNKPTNVLSFPNDDAPLGDVVLAYETIVAEAEQQEKTFRDHSAHLLVHGVLHLMGYDHESEKDAAAMEKKEINILKKLGVKNPYL